MKMKSNPILLWRLWRRNRKLRRATNAAKLSRLDAELKLAQANQKISALENDLKKLNEQFLEDGRQMRGKILESSSKAAAKHYDAFKWAHDYKVMELHLAATTAERDSYLKRMRELSDEVQKLQTELSRTRDGNI
jgi:glycyl-tRNA synthetase alpha subunit